MNTPKDILVVTSSSVDGIKIRKYLKPVSAHIVAGTNLFSDFLGGLSDIFGGRSTTYQNQLTSLYNEAIERIKVAAYEIGSNCILGLNIDMDEISGKGKSMFMLTAVGTAVIVEKEVTEIVPFQIQGERFKNVGLDRINNLRTKLDIIAKANSGNLALNDDIWRFITSNQVEEVFPYLLKKYEETFAADSSIPETSANFYKSFIVYIAALPEDRKLYLLYINIKSLKNDRIALKLSTVVEELNLFDFNLCMELLQSDDFKTKKRGLRIIGYDKPFYNKQDVQDLQSLKEYVKITFIERGTRTTRKVLLSSKEKEVWICECGKTNDIGNHCAGCDKDIYGFSTNEFKPVDIDNYIQQKIDLISEFVE